MNHLVGNTEEAEDLAQEVFLRVYRARKKYRPRSKFSTWLFTIANNLALNSLRARQRKPVVPLLSPQDSGPMGEAAGADGARPADRADAEGAEGRAGRTASARRWTASTSGRRWPWSSTSSRT